MTRPRFEVENSKVRIKTFGGGKRSGTRDESGPRKMTVGCVIRIVPRRKSVSQAVIEEITNARTEIVVDKGSVMIKVPSAKHRLIAPPRGHA
jgi:hypothetical protein